MLTLKVCFNSRVCIALSRIPRQSVELAALERRISFGLEEHGRSFRQAHEHLALRYGNLTRAVQRQQLRNRVESERQLVVALGTRPASRRSGGDNSVVASAAVRPVAVGEDCLPRYERYIGTKSGIMDAYLIGDATERPSQRSRRTGGATSGCSSPVKKAGGAGGGSQRPSTAPIVGTTQGRSTALNGLLASTADAARPRSPPSKAQLRSSVARRVSTAHRSTNTMDRMRSIYCSGLSPRDRSAHRRSEHSLGPRKGGGVRSLARALPAVEAGDDRSLLSGSTTGGRLQLPPWRGVVDM